MKTKKLILFLFLLGFFPSLVQGEGTSSPVPNTPPGWYKTLQVQEMALNKEKKIREKILEKMVAAKMYLINGNTQKAKRLVMALQGQNKLTEKIGLRYMAIIHFIENNFEESLDLLNHRSLFSDKDFQKFCLLKILNLIALNKTFHLLSEYNRCVAVNLRSSPTDHAWLDGLVKLATRDSSLLRKQAMADIFSEPQNIDDSLLKVLLKLAIYMNKEKSIVNLLFNLPQHVYESTTIRELIGFIFYRVGDVEQALNFLEDLTTPNAENIKGNIELQKKAYELAFGHFQLALKKKQNSSNAIERSIPLAWQLGQWHKGIEMVKQMKANPSNRKKKIALMTAFQLRANDHKSAQENLQELYDLFRGKFPKEVNILKSFNALILDEPENLVKYSDASCNHLDALNCWLLLQTSIWPNISKTIRRKDPIYDDNNLTFESLREKVELDPLEENIYIRQQDIEEMDNRLFELKF